MILPLKAPVALVASWELAPIEAAGFVPTTATAEVVITFRPAA